MPGIGVTSARRIIQARRSGRLTVEGLRRLGVVMKRAQYFLTVGGKMPVRVRLNQAQLIGALSSERGMALPPNVQQLSFLEPTGDDLIKSLSGQI